MLLIFARLWETQFCSSCPCLCENAQGFSSKSATTPSGQDHQKLHMLISAYVRAGAKSAEMHRDSHQKCHRNVRSDLDALSKLHRDSHHRPHGHHHARCFVTKNPQGFSSPTATKCVWLDTFVRNRIPAYDFCRPVMRNLRVPIDLCAPSREVAYCALGAAYMSVVR